MVFYNGTISSDSKGSEIFYFIPKLRFTRGLDSAQNWRERERERESRHELQFKSINGGPSDMGGDSIQEARLIGTTLVRRICTRNYM